MASNTGGKWGGALDGGGAPPRLIAGTYGAAGTLDANAGGGGIAFLGAYLAPRKTN